MAGHGEKMSRKQEALIAALLTSSSIAKAAQSVGINEKTARRWMATGGFARAYLLARRQGVDHAIALLQGMTGLAILAVADALRDEDNDVRLRAAKVTFDVALRGVELSDMAEQLAQLQEDFARLTSQHERKGRWQPAAPVAPVPANADAKLPPRGNVKPETDGHANGHIDPPEGPPPLFEGEP